MIEKIYNVSSKPMDVFFLYCFYAVSKYDLDEATIFRITKRADVYVQSLGDSPLNKHRQLYCENIILTYLNRLSLLINPTVLFKLYKTVNVVSSISNGLRSKYLSNLAWAAVGGLNQQLCSNSSMSLAEALRSNKGGKGMLINIVEEPACGNLISVMKDLLTEEERREILDCVDCKGRMSSITW